MNGYGRGFSALPPVVKNLIIINVLLLVITGLSEAFSAMISRPFWVFTFLNRRCSGHSRSLHMFMHAGFWHLFFNMFALYMFGGVLETVWGPKRFFIYYMVCGLGAALVHESVIAIQYAKVMKAIRPDQLQLVLADGAMILSEGKQYADVTMKNLQMILNIPTVGASGAIFGILLAFGVLFPNTQLLLLFPPIPIRAKYFVIGYGAIELWLALTQPGSNIAHAAHLGGMLFGYILIRYWRKTSKTLY